MILGGGEWSASRSGLKAPGTHWIGDWVGPRAVLDSNSKFVPVSKPNVVKVNRTSGVKTPNTFNLGSIWKWVDTIMLRPLYTWGRSPGTYSTAAQTR